MIGSWREISRILGIILALALTAYNLYVGTDIFLALFRGIAAWLVFTIVNILLTTTIYKVINEYEYKRLQDLNQLEDALAMDDDDDEDEDLLAPSAAKGRAE